MWPNRNGSYDMVLFFAFLNCQVMRSLTGAFANVLAQSSEMITNARRPWKTHLPQVYCCKTCMAGAGRTVVQQAESLNSHVHQLFRRTHFNFANIAICVVERMEKCKRRVVKSQEINVLTAKRAGSINILGRNAPEDLTCLSPINNSRPRLSIVQTYGLGTAP